MDSFKKEVLCHFLLSLYLFVVEDLQNWLLFPRSQFTTYFSGLVVMFYVNLKFVLPRWGHNMDFSFFCLLFM